MAFRNRRAVAVWRSSSAGVGGRVAGRSIGREESTLGSVPEGCSFTGPHPWQHGVAAAAGCGRTGRAASGERSGMMGVEAAGAPPIAIVAIDLRSPAASDANVRAIAAAVRGERGAFDLRVRYVGWSEGEPALLDGDDSP